jgi:hypothetical protein
MRTRLFTNRRDNTLLDKFAGVFANNPDLPDAWLTLLRDLCGHSAAFFSKPAGGTAPEEDAA